MGKRAEGEGGADGRVDRIICRSSSVGREQEGTANRTRQTSVLLIRMD